VLVKADKTRSRFKDSMAAYESSGSRRIGEDVKFKMSQEGRRSSRSAQEQTHIVNIDDAICITFS